MNEKEIYAAALEHYGELSQHDKLIEEMSELTKAILKHRRKPTVQTLRDLHDEFADVEIVMQQIRISLSTYTLEGFKKMKLDRLEQRIAKGPADDNLYKS